MTPQQKKKVISSINAGIDRMYLDCDKSVEHYQNIIHLLNEDKIQEARDYYTSLDSHTKEFLLFTSAKLLDP